MVAELLPIVALERVRQAGGDDAVRRVLAATAAGRDYDPYADHPPALSGEQLGRLLGAAAAELGGAAGLRSLDLGASRVVLGAIRAHGGPTPILERLPQTPLGELLAIRVEEVAAGRWDVDGHAPDGRRPGLEPCAFLLGLLQLVPTAFGEAAVEAAELSCQARGDRRCRFRLRWRPRDRSEVERSVGVELERLARRHRTFRDTLAEILFAPTVDDAVDKVVAAAAGQIDAGGLVLSLEPLAGVERRVRAIGVDDAIAAALARRLRGVDDGDVPKHAAVAITSKNARYGHLAAVCDEPLPLDQREALAAYAQLAAARLDAAASLELARREGRRTSALLELATGLAECTTVAELGGVLARAVAAVVDADRASFAVGGDEHWDVVAVAGDGPPSGTFEVAIEIEGRRRGLLRVEVGPDGVDAEAAARVRSLAAQAAPTLRNVLLLEGMRHEPFRDPDSGLPNRAVLLDRTRLLLARARRDRLPVGLLHLDLRGPADLPEVVGRVDATVRESDTVARLEDGRFVVLAGEGDVEILAKRLLDAVGEVAPTASIGAARTVHGGADELFRAAELALARATPGEVLVQADIESVADELERALERRELVLDYEPLLDDETDVVIGAVAVPVLRRASGSDVTGQSLLRHAEDAGLGAAVGRWALREAARQMARWTPLWRDVPGLPFVAVELPAEYRSAASLAADVADAVAAAGIDRTQLVVAGPTYSRS